MNNNYVNHNRRILHAVASEQHQKWEKDRDQRALKRAKRGVMPMIGKTFNCLSQLKVLLVG